MGPSRLVLFSIVVAMAVNFYYQAFYILHDVRNFHRFQSPPGQAFVGLRPYLKNILWAGYYSDNRSAAAFSDLNSMFFYQQAQFSLSPTLLDYYHPFRYKFIIFNCKDQKYAQRKITELHGHPMAVVGGGILLVRRGE